MYTKSDLDTLFDKKPHKTDLYMKSNVSTLRWQMWQNKHRSENEAWKNSGLYGICTHDLCNTNRELVIMLDPNEPVKWWINDCKYMKIVSFFQAYFQYRQSLSRGHCVTAKIAFVFTSLSAVHIHDFHIFTDKTIIIIKENGS